MKRESVTRTSSFVSGKRATNLELFIKRDREGKASQSELTPSPLTAVFGSFFALSIEDDTVFSLMIKPHRGREKVVVCCRALIKNNFCSGGN